MTKNPLSDGVIRILRYVYTERSECAQNDINVALLGQVSSMGEGEDEGEPLTLRQAQGKLLSAPFG